jgi:hypothetical protein
MTTREKWVSQLTTRISRDQYPRLQMMMIVGLTGLSGLLSSFIMLKLGVWNMMIRYPLAVLGSYLAFLLFLRLWIWWQQRGLNQSEESSQSKRRSSSNSGWDIPNFGGGSGSGGGNVSSSDFGGGSFGGGGAGGSYETGVAGQMIMPVMPQGSSNVSSFSEGSSGGGSKGGGSFDLDLDEGAGILIIIVVVAAIFASFFYVIYIAPAFFAELLVDGALSAGLYQQMKGLEKGNWLFTAVKKTSWVVLVVMLVLGTCGYFMHQMDPTAHSIGEFWRHL